MLGRRGPAQAAFTSAELRELGHLDGVDLRVDPDDVELDPVSRAVAGEQGTFTARKNVELLREFAARRARPDAERRIGCASCARRWRSTGPARVEAIDVAPQRDRARRRRLLRARPLDGHRETIECGLVLRSVGYRAVPLPDVPFDERYFVLPNERGRVLTPDGEPLPGVYAVGWIKRGPTGILGTNKRDAEETVNRLAEDLKVGALPQPPDPGREQIDALLVERKPDLVTADGLARDRRLELEARSQRAAPAGQAGVARRAAVRRRLWADCLAVAEIADREDTSGLDVLLRPKPTSPSRPWWPQ